MKNKIPAVLLLTFLFSNVLAQKLKKCTLFYDKELGMSIYQDVDSAAVPLRENSLDSVFLSDNFKFKSITNKYPEKQMVKIGYIIDKNGNPSLLKVFYPTGDKEIEAEAKRLVGLIPLHKPCKCKQEAVPCYGVISMPLVSRKK